MTDSSSQNNNPKANKTTDSKSNRQYRKPRSKLSNRLFLAAISVSVFIGILLSGTQILFDAKASRQELNQQFQSILGMVTDSATQAIYQLDKTMASQVIDGLFENPSVSYAGIMHYDGIALTERHRQLPRTAYEPISQLIFGEALTYTFPLQHKQITYLDAKDSKAAKESIELYGHMIVTINPSLATESFINRASFLLLGGLVQSVCYGLALYFLFQFLITRPMTRIIKNLEDVNPNQPTFVALNIPKGHEDDEIGTWIKKVNGLFEAVKKYYGERLIAEAHVEHLSNYDLLTELPNRRLLIKHLEQTIAESNEKDQPFALLCCALDDFNAVNLLHSYHTGDKILLMLAERLRETIGNKSQLARLGGDMFALIVPNITPNNELKEIANKLLETIHLPFNIDQHSIQISASLGITCYPDDGINAETLLKNSENVMQLAKAQGGHGYEFYEQSVGERLRDTKLLEKSLSLVVQNEELQLEFQPQVLLATQQIIGVEALVRWHHPKRGLISPSEFIPIAENNQTIIKIGDWVLEQACRTLEFWKSVSPTAENFTISVNVSAVQLHYSDLVKRITYLIQRYKINPWQLVLEITETAVMSNVDSAIDILSGLKETGVQIAIDDFGTGHSSLSYIKQMPLDKIKIDGSFVHDIMNDTNNATIVNAIIQLGHSLNYTVIAEGTETQAQVEYLSDCGCDIAQGYYFYKPLKATELLRVVKQQSIKPVTNLVLDEDMTIPGLHRSVFDISNVN
ncbi:MAG: EAL domain-containing protein [Pseudomonadales bacterium]|nr:EAL domain-containing protein [Pseudomonadales bacterium]